jgi:hypothetical protein
MSWIGLGDRCSFVFASALQRRVRRAGRRVSQSKKNFFGFAGASGGAALPLRLHRRLYGIRRWRICPDSTLDGWFAPGSVLPKR